MKELETGQDMRDEANFGWGRFQRGGGYSKRAEGKALSLSC